MKMLLLQILMTAVTLQPLKYGNLMVICVYIYIYMYGHGSQRLERDLRKFLIQPLPERKVSCKIGTSC